MSDILIVYSSVDGQTRRICDRLAEILTDCSRCAKTGRSGCVKTVSVEQVTAADLHAAGKIIIGASVRYGRHRKNVYTFISTHQAEIESRPNAFFSVNVVARKPAKNTPQTNPYMRKFLEQSGWQPQQLAVFAGKIDYRKYRFIDRIMIRFIMWLTDGPTEPDACVEFTDWEQVGAFARACDAL